MGVIERADNVTHLANLLRSLCTSYSVYHAHEVVLRVPLPSTPAGTQLRFTRRLPQPGATARHREEAPERWVLTRSLWPEETGHSTRAAGCVCVHRGVGW